MNRLLCFLFGHMWPYWRNELGCPHCIWPQCGRCGIRR